MKTTAKWSTALAFDVTSDSHHTIRLDTSQANGGLDSGMSPKQAVLAGLCGCSGIDVVDILNKMRVPFSKLSIEAEAEQTDTHPKVFKWIKMVYKCDVQPDDLDKLQRAAQLSHEKYCGVSIMLKKHCDISFAVELL
ncbi:MAG: OsmC family protein [Bacteroidota bacterium]|nr:OsmC family protein [Bacteroidota bacterium]